MSRRRFEYTDFSHKGARYRIGAAYPEIVQDEIAKLRLQLEAYIDLYPDFEGSLIPIEPVPSAPPIALQMHKASEVARVGPLAAVAGAIAEHSARALPREHAGCDVIVENGGDIFIISSREIVVSLFAGENPVSQHLAFKIPPSRCPLAICSSSSVMGHSKSFGKADLVTVVAGEGALADAVATALCNQVKSAEDIDGVLERGVGIPGVDGVLIAIGDRVGMIGDLPELIRHHDPRAGDKITRSKYR